MQAVKLDLKNTSWNSWDCEATQTLAQTHAHNNIHYTYTWIIKKNI
jgi:hypothetical protein